MPHKTNLPRSGPQAEGPPDIQWLLDQMVDFYLKHGGPTEARNQLNKIAAALSFMGGWSEAYCHAMDSIEHLCATPMPTTPPTDKPLLPDKLCTPHAMRIWQRLQEANLIDSDYYPLTSRTQSAVIAYEMGRRLGIADKWKTFEALWNRKNMRIDYNKAMAQTQTTDFLDILKPLLDT